jgi:GntR family transcriptional regulator
MSQRITGVTRYHQLYTTLSHSLMDGTVEPGRPLPSEPTLVKRYGISRTTVRRALARLEAEGRIDRRRGSGTFARGNGARPRIHVRADRLLEDLRTIGDRSTAKLLQYEEVETPPSIRRFAPDFDDRSLYIQRTRSMDGEPFVLATSHVPQQIGKRLTRRRLGNELVLLALAKLGVRPVSGEQVTTAVAADAFAARELKVPMGSPLLRIRRVIRDSRGRAIEHQEYLYRPERYENHMRLDLGKVADGARAGGRTRRRRGRPG